MKYPVCGIVTVSDTTTLQSLKKTTQHGLCDNWELLPSEVIMDDTLGEGAFGLVYKGFISGSSLCRNVKWSFRNSTTVTIAVKILKGKPLHLCEISLCYIRSQSVQLLVTVFLGDG